MKRNIYIILFFLFTTINPFFVAAQNTSISDRTPEQEAKKQTEKLQNELNLNSEQTKSVYIINLRYARERQQSNTRAEAMERIRNKNEEIRKELTADQYDELLNKKNKIQSVEIGNTQRYMRTSPRNRVNNTPRQNQVPTDAGSSTDINRRNSSVRSENGGNRINPSDNQQRSVRPNYQGSRSTDSNRPNSSRFSTPTTPTRDIRTSRSSERNSNSSDRSSDRSRSTDQSSRR